MVLFFIAAISVYIFIEPYLVKINEVIISDPDIPDAFEGKKIVFVSDIHFGFNYSSQRLERLVKKINNLQPDLILLGGDYIEKKANLAGPCFTVLKNLAAPLGVYGVLGNHDYWESEQTVMTAMGNAGIQNIDNLAFWLNINGEKIKVGGIGDLWESKQDLNPTVADVSPDDFVILVSHNPEYTEEIKNNKIDLVLSGHHHGGQVNLFGLWTFFMRTNYGTKYRSGIIQTDFTKTLVSNGIGTTLLPIRFMARPEINEIVLKQN